MTVQVSVVQGDITTIRADALITCIDSAGSWYGGVNAAIQQLAGGHLHHQAYAELPLKDGEIIVGHGNNPELAFRNVVFIVDELATPLSELVLAALKKANSQHFAHVTLPLLRTGSTNGLRENSVGEAIAQLVAGVKALRDLESSYLGEVVAVVYNNYVWAQYLERALEILES